MKIVCSGNMPFAAEAFGTLGETVILAERSITADDVRDADILAIRSTTKVNRELVEGSSVKFVGTATIGYDHMDTAYLQKHGIEWYAAAGCNANSVSEYVVSALLCLAKRHNLGFARRTMGVIGVGNVGTLVARKARALGMKVLLNDPPRERAGGGDVEFTPLDRLLKKSDIVTLHVPLTRDGLDPTFKMADTTFFERMKNDSIFINSARGKILYGEALEIAVEDGVVAHSVIDTWDPEPAYPRGLLSSVDLGTPHIAGHSFEGKVNGTFLVYQAACRHLGIQPSWNPEPFMPPPAVPRLTVDARGRTDEDVLWEIVSQVYNIEEDDARLRALKSDNAAQLEKHFDSLRKNYPIRREFRYTRVFLRNASPSLASAVSELGFRPA